MNVTVRRESTTKFNDYSYRHGKELLKTLHPKILKEVEETLGALEPFPHGAVKHRTGKNYIADAFANKGWSVEASADFSTDKSDWLDLAKWKVAMEMEFSRFEMFFRDFFRFMLLYERRVVDVGIILTLDDMAYERWKGNAKPHQHSRASLRKVIDFLEGDYRSIIRVPLWCIGIE